MSYSLWSKPKQNSVTEFSLLLSCTITLKLYICFNSLTNILFKAKQINKNSILSESSLSKRPSPHCNADASNPTLKTTFMEMGPRTKFIWSYETPICFLQSCDYSTLLFFATTICLSLVHWQISNSHVFTTLETVEAIWSFINHSRHFGGYPFSYWSTLFYPFIDRWGKLEFHKTKSAFL